MQKTLAMAPILSPFRVSAAALGGLGETRGGMNDKSGNAKLQAMIVRAAPKFRRTKQGGGYP